ncbi:MAG: hypothetical protein M3N04_00125 [Actinomycetota bacterium]|nr:hypothetical protein [Actinomycetota bacterium]
MKANALQIIALAGAVIAVAATPAVAGWSQPRTLGTPAGYVVPLGVQADAFGRLVVSWIAQRQTSARSAARVYTLSRSPNGTFGMPRSRLEQVGEPAIYGRGQLLYLLSRRVDSDRVTIGVAFGAAGGAATVRTIARRIALGASPVLAANRRGHAVIAWTERSGQRTLIRVAERHRGRAFGRARTLGSSRFAGVVAVAVGERGDVVVAYQRRRGARRYVIEARFRRADGRWLRPEQAGRAAAGVELAVHVSSEGAGYLAWRAQSSGDAARIPWLIRAAVRERNARFTESQVIDQSGVAERAVGQLALVPLRGGGAALAWSGSSRPAADRHPVRVATAAARGVFGTPVELAADGVLGDIAASASEILVTWSRGGIIYAASADTRGTFKRAQVISSNERAEQPRAAFDAAGRPTLIWAARPDSARAVVRTTTRDLRVRVAGRQAVRRQLP